jgi:AcrR family transcriptional regulator
MHREALARGMGHEPGSPGVPYQKLKPGPGKDAVAVAGHQRARIHSAMLELVAEKGYDAVTVRDLAQAAAVSTRTFYKHYSSKEWCFVRVNQLMVQRVLRVLEFSRERAAEERVRLSAETIAGAWASEAKAARLLCVDAYAAGPVALRHAYSARRSIEIAIDESFGERSGSSKPSLIAEAIVAGVYGATRRYQLEGRDFPYAYLSEALVSWMITCCTGFPRLDELARLPAPEDFESSVPPAEARNQAERARDFMSSKGDLAALVSGAAKIAAAESYQTLTLPKLVEAAGVSRRTFSANFSSLEECFLEALQVKAVHALARVRGASESGVTPEESIYRAVATLCRQVENDKSFASLCFDAYVAPGIPKMRLQQVFVDNFAFVVADRLESVRRIDQLEVQLSVGSVWGLIGNQVTAGRTHGLYRKAPTLTYLLLAPVIGASMAMKAICQEHVLTT